MASSVDDSFTDWVMENGGTPEFIDILREFGFSSKLSLSNLDIQEDTELLNRFNCGQKCLLRGLVKLLRDDSNYSSCVKQVEKTRKRIELPRMKSRINELFSFKSAKSKSGQSSSMSDDDDFLPQPMFRPPPKKCKSGKGKEPSGKPLQLKKVSNT